MENSINVFPGYLVLVVALFFLTLPVHKMIMICMGVTLIYALIEDMRNAEFKRDGRNHEDYRVE